MVKTTAANQNLYVMRLSMSSPFFVRASEANEAENSKKMFFKFSPSDRKKIQAIRQRVNVVKNAGCANFYGLAIVNDLTKQQVTDLLVTAEQDMRAIDPELIAEVKFLPLDTAAFTSGTLFENLTAQIREQIHGVVLKRIEKTIADQADEDAGGVLSSKTKNALLKMLEKCKAVNVIGDEDINTRIEEMKGQINNDQILVMREEILSLLDATKGRFASIDMFGSGIPPEATETVPELTGDEQPGEIHAFDTSGEDTPAPTRRNKKSRFGMANL